MLIKLCSVSKFEAGVVLIPPGSVNNFLNLKAFWHFCLLSNAILVWNIEQCNIGVQYWFDCACFGYNYCTLYLDLFIEKVKFRNKILLKFFFPIIKNLMKKSLETPFPQNFSAANFFSEKLCHNIATPWVSFIA